MASTTRKLFVVSQDSIVVENIQKWATKCGHEVTVNSTIPENASVVDFNAVDFIILDGNLAHDDNYNFIQLVSKIPVVVIPDITDNKSYKKIAEAHKKGAIDYWYPPIDEEKFNKIESIILGEKALSTSKRKTARVEEGQTSSEVQSNEDKRKKVKDSPPVGLYQLEGGDTIRYVKTPGLPP